MTQETRLPIGGTLDHGGRSLRIVKLLTDKGLTSRVYEGWLASEDQSGEIHIAVKAMKSLDFPLARQSFEQEGITLASLMRYEEQANQEQRLALKIAPIYYSAGEYHEMPYLVMEFISGKEIPDLLQEQGGKLPEAQALTIAWHLLRTLDLLHTRLKKTYVDLKYENMWWVSSAEEGSGQLKLLDFGTLEEIKPGDELPRGVRRDLLQSGVYLCGMLTGQLPDYSMVGYLRDPWETDRIIRQHMGEMSWGAYKLLSQLLHRNPQARPTSAASLASELRTLVNFWTSPLDKVLDAAQKLLVKAEAEAGDESQRAEAHELAARARAALGIAYLRNPEDESIASDIERAENVLSISDYLERGKKLLQTRSPDLAREVFEEGIHWSDDPGSLRRWAYLARIGEDISPTVFDEHSQAAMQMLDWINDGGWPHALERLEQLRPDMQSPGLDMLHADANLFMQIAKAEAAHTGAAKDYAKAASAFREAMSWLEKLPDADFIKTEEVGDLYLQAKEMEDLQATVGEARAGMAEAESLTRQPEPDWEQSIAKASQAFALDRANSERLEDLQRLAEAALQQFNFTTGLQIAEIGLQSGKPPEGLLSVFHLARYLQGAERALLAGERDNFHAALREARDAFGSNPAAEPAVRRLRNRAAKRAVEVSDVDWIEELAQLAEDQGDLDWAAERRSEAQKWASHRDNRLRDTIDKLLSDATYLLIYDDLEPTQAEQLAANATMVETTAYLQQRRFRLEEAVRLTTDAERIAKEIDHRRDDIESLRVRIDKAANTGQEQTVRWEQRVGTERQARLDMLNRLWKELQRFLEWGQGGISAGARGVILGHITRQAEEDAKELVRQCQVYLATLDASDAHIRDLLEDIYQDVDKLGLQGWDSLRQLADERTEIIRGEFRQAHLAFEQGDQAAAAVEIDRLAVDYSLAPEWLDLKTRLVQVDMWQAWQQKHADLLDSGNLDAILLKSIRGFISLGLPGIYYHQVKQYLQRVLKTTSDMVKAQLDYPDSSDFIHALRLWMDVELTTRMLENNSKG
jgi:serine/threonine protein kinase